MLPWSSQLRMGKQTLKNTMMDATKENVQDVTEVNKNCNQFQSGISTKISIPSQRMVVRQGNFLENEQANQQQKKVTLQHGAFVESILLNSNQFLTILIPVDLLSLQAYNLTLSSCFSNMCMYVYTQVYMCMCNLRLNIDFKINRPRN